MNNWHNTKYNTHNEFYLKGYLDVNLASSHEERKAMSWYIVQFVIKSIILDKGEITFSFFLIYKGRIMNQCPMPFVEQCCCKGC